MVHKDPNQRYDIDRVLDDDWFKEDTATVEEVKVTIEKYLEKVKQERQEKLEKELEAIQNSFLSVS